jgi:hypothetical protein
MVEKAREYFIIKKASRLWVGGENNFRDYISAICDLISPK